METKICKSPILTFGLLVFLSGCQADSSTTNFEYLLNAKIEEKELVIYNDNDSCAVRFNDSLQGELLGIPYPCGFVRANKKLEAQTYYYEKIGQVFVVAGSVADKSSYSKDSGVDFEHMCSNYGQAIIIYDNKLILRESHETPLGFCHHLGFDEKDFYGFAYPVN